MMTTTPPAAVCDAVAALDGEPGTRAFKRFARGGWNHEVVNRYAYLQLKRVGGGGTANGDEICGRVIRHEYRPRSHLALFHRNANSVKSAISNHQISCCSIPAASRLLVLCAYGISISTMSLSVKSS
jgi:hypothetical protein